MRSKDYKDQVASFTPLEPQQIVRVALVVGMKPEYPHDETQRYGRLVKRFLRYDPKEIDLLYRLMQVEKPTSGQSWKLQHLISEVAYDSNLWGDFDYDRLEGEGVIIRYKGNLRQLERSLQDIDESKVIFTPEVGERTIPPNDEVDYLKHINWRNILYLNGKDVVLRFAQDRDIELPVQYTRNGYIPTKVLDILVENGFYFIEAFKTAVGDLKDPKHRNKIISTMAIKRRDGTELRLHPHDFVEAAEFYIYCLLYKMKIIQPLGPYYGANTFYVPKRIPIEGKTFNEVELHYFPDPRGKSTYPLDWMNTRVTCNCPHALNMRNFEVRRGKTTRVVETMDTHANMVFLNEMDKQHIKPEEALNNMSPIPTLEFSDFVDKGRYNLVLEFEVEGRRKPRIRRTYVGEAGLEILIHELMKEPDWPFERMFNPHEKVGRLLLKPMYV